MEVFLRFAAMLLGILGAVQLGEVFSIWLRRPKERPPISWVLPLSGEVEDVEQILGYFQEVAMWSPESQLAFVVDCGLGAQSARLCKLWCEGTRLIFCTQKEFQEICKGSEDKVY